MTSIRAGSRAQLFLGLIRSTRPRLRQPRDVVYGSYAPPVTLSANDCQVSRGKTSFGPSGSLPSRTATTWPSSATSTQLPPWALLRLLFRQMAATSTHWPLPLLQLLLRQGVRNSSDTPVIPHLHSLRPFRRRGDQRGRGIRAERHCAQVIE